MLSNRVRIIKIYLTCIYFALNFVINKNGEVIVLEVDNPKHSPSTLTGKWISRAGLLGSWKFFRQPFSSRARKENPFLQEYS
jgi:hypothetical protein